MFGLGFGLGAASLWTRHWHNPGSLTLTLTLVCHIHGHSLRLLQLCDIRMPSLLFWNHALLASLERSFDWKTGEFRYCFLVFSLFFKFQVVADVFQDCLKL